MFSEERDHREIVVERFLALMNWILRFDIVQGEHVILSHEKFGYLTAQYLEPLNSPNIFECFRSEHVVSIIRLRRTTGLSR